jgi:hypothetical protein
MVKFNHMKFLSVVILVAVFCLIANLDEFGNVEAATGLTAGYSFTEGSGTTTADTSGNNISGTLVNGPTWTTGHSGNALQFDGVNDYVSLGNSATLPMGGSFTVSAWVNESGNPADDGEILSKADGTLQFKSSPDTGNRTFGIGFTNTTGSNIQRYSSTVRSLNTWYYVTGVYNSATPSLDIYVNGVLDNGTLSGTIPTSRNASSANFEIGRRADFGLYLNGKIDDLRIYNRALSLAEIQSDMNTPVGGTPPPADTTPPTASISSPTNGATVSGSTTISANASDNVSVAGVTFKLDGNDITSEDVSSPYSISWDTTQTSNGSHTLTATARDTSNNTTTSSSVSVTVSNVIAPPPPPPPGTYPWSNIIDPVRATDWSKAGVNGGIPSATWTQCGSTINPPSTSAVINAAIASCGQNQYVKLGPGTFNNMSQIVIDRSNVALRGSGSSQTKLVFTSAAGGCAWFLDSPIRICPGGVNSPGSGGGPPPDNTATWSAGYAKGTSVITVSSNSGLVARSGSTPGTTIFLDQLNDNVTDGLNDGWPGPGDILICSSGSNGCSWEGAGSGVFRPNRVQTELHEVVSFTGTAPNIQVTIDPPIHSPNFRLSQQPQAWWGNNSSHVKRSGVEDLTVDWTALHDDVNGTFAAGILMVNTSNSWIRGVRDIMNDSPASFQMHVNLLMSFRPTIKDSYFYGPTGNVGNNITNYAYGGQLVGGVLLENNIFHNNISAVIPNDPMTGSVISYNYFDSSHYGPNIQPHNPGDLYNLYEGNNGNLFMGDNIHGTHYFNTLFRNHFDLDSHNQDSVAENGGILLLSHNRFYNLIGNVLGSNSYTAYKTLSAGTPNSSFMFGYQGSHSGTGPANDSNVNRTVMVWGNWDSVTSSNDNGANDSTGTRFVASEVPSGISSFFNPVPASQALPASFYLTNQPSWWATPWGTPHWPPIGPDVVASGATKVTTSPTGGHADKIPARLCFENSPVDPAYPTSSPRIKLIEATTCYASASSQPTPLVGDINLDHIVNSVDYSILNSHWFTNDSSSDLNHDGLVNAIDYSILNSNWFKTW